MENRGPNKVIPYWLLDDQLKARDILSISNAKINKLSNHLISKTLWPF